LLQSFCVRGLIPATLIGILLGQLTEPGVRGGPLHVQINEDIMRQAFWLIAGVVVGVICDRLSKI
jgi:hypothetical protein